MVCMLKHSSTRGSLFLFVRAHHQLAYYFDLADPRNAANQDGISAPHGVLGPDVLARYGSSPAGNVFEIHPISQARSRRGQ
jgi:hypothetical protein